MFAVAVTLVGLSGADGSVAEANEIDSESPFAFFARIEKITLLPDVRPETVLVVAVELTVSVSPLVSFLIM